MALPLAVVALAIPGIGGCQPRIRMVIHLRAPRRCQPSCRRDGGTQTQGPAAVSAVVLTPSRLKVSYAPRMGRPPRPTDDHLTYHAINRGNDRRVVLADDEDHLAFLRSLARTQLRYPFRLDGYCLMSNHFHLLIRPEPGVTISRVLQSLSIAHTRRFHRRHGSSGHVWQGRFKSPVVQDDGHLGPVLRSVEVNSSAPGWSPTRATTAGRATRRTVIAGPTRS